MPQADRPARRAFISRRQALATLAAVTTGPLVPAWAAGKLQVVVGGTSFRGTVGEAHWLSFGQRAVAARGGEIDVRMLIHGELGSEENLVSGLRRGRVQYANLSSLIASSMSSARTAFVRGCSPGGR